MRMGGEAKSYVVAARILPLLFAVTMFAGCSTDPHVKKLRVEKSFGDTYARAIDRGEVSAPVYGFLVLHGWDKQWKTDPAGVLRQVVDAVYSERSREALYAATELSYLCAKNRRLKYLDKPSLDLAAAFYAFHYLYDPEFGSRPSAYDPRLVIATEIYNRSLSAFGADNLVHVARNEVTKYQLPRGELSLIGSLLELPYDVEIDDATYYDAYKLSVKGIDVLSQSYGVGGSLVVALQPSAASRSEDIPYVNDRPAAFPMSLLLRSELCLFDATGEKPVYSGWVKLNNSLAQDSIQFDAETLPLAADYTAALGVTIGENKAPPYLLAMLRPETMQKARGLYLLQPFQRGKIPVVFVHGLMSIPRTWVPMLNGLLSDPTIRERYQFWFYLYPTGNPAGYSAYLLRRDLTKMRDLLDPQHTDTALDNMVLAGHSMGGLMSHMVMIDSGEDGWNSISDKPFDEANIPETHRELIRQMFFFEHLPFVKRAIFISAPHRGSDMATDPIGRIGRSLIRLPFEVAGPFTDALFSAGRLSDVEQKKWAKALPNSIDSLSPTNPFLQALDKKTIAVPYHSIIGDTKAAGRTDGTDGIVSYWSSHLDGAESELVVKSSHNAHKVGPAINEVRRILLLHLTACDSKDTPSQRPEGALK